MQRNEKRVAYIQKDKYTRIKATIRNYNGEQYIRICLWARDPDDPRHKYHATPKGLVFPISRIKELMDFLGEIKTYFGFSV